MIAHRIVHLCVLGSLLLTSFGTHAQQPPPRKIICRTDFERKFFGSACSDTSNAPQPTTKAYGPAINYSIPLNLNVNMISNQFPIEHDSELGLKMATSIVQDTPLVDTRDPRVQIMTKVGNHLVRALGDDNNRAFVFTFDLLEANSRNAYALPGGPILVHTGLWPKIKNEAQLAGLLAHLMIHVLDRHMTDAYIKSAGIQGSLAAGSASYTAESSFVKALAAQAASIFVGRYINKQLVEGNERQANRSGVRLMARAGYNPPEFAKFMRSLNGLVRKAEFIKKHPDSDDVGIIEKEFNQLQLSPVRLTAGATLNAP